MEFDTHEGSPLLIRYQIPSLGLYELTYLTEPLLELIVLGKGIEERDRAILTDFFVLGDPTCPPPRRWGISQLALEGFYFRHNRALRIKSIREGSLEITLAEATALCATLVAFTSLCVNLYFQRKATKSPERVMVVESDEKYVHDFMRALERGEFGGFEEAFPLLREVLAMRGYDLDAVSPTIYNIMRTNVIRTQEAIKTSYRIKR